MLDAAPLLEHLHQRLVRIAASRHAAGDDPTSASLQALDVRLLAAFDDRFDALALAREARGLLHAALASAADDVGKAEVAALEQPLADLERALALLGRPAPAQRSFQRALTRLDALHLDRPLIVPTPPPALRVAPEGPPPPGLLADSMPALTPAGFGLQRMDELFFDLCAGLVHRRPQGAELWSFVRFAEVRALRALDALAALDLSLLGAFEQGLSGSPAPDPACALGLTVLGGCLSGRDGLAMAERLLHVQPAEQEAIAAHAEGLVLVRHPLVELIAREHLRSNSEDWRWVGAATLAQRGTASPAELAACARDVPRVAAEALLPLSLLGLPEVRDLLDEVHAGAQVAGGAVLHAYLEGALVSGHPYAIDLLGSAAQRADEHAIRLLGIAAERGTAAELHAWCQRAPSVALADALGWAGDPAFINLLIELLSSDDEPLTHAAAGALERITGAGLREMVAIEPDADEGPPSAPPLDPDVRDPVPEGSPDLVELPSRNPDLWRAYVREHEAEWTSGVRTRHGAPYSAAGAVRDLHGHPCSFSARRLMYLEFMVRTGWTFRFNLRAFVDEQQALLGELDGIATQYRGTPGEWARPMQRRALQLGGWGGPGGGLGHAAYGGIAGAAGGFQPGAY